jgi:hypothetical protein
MFRCQFQPPLLPGGERASRRIYFLVIDFLRHETTSLL